MILLLYMPGSVKKSDRVGEGSSSPLVGDTSESEEEDPDEEDPDGEDPNGNGEEEEASSFSDLPFLLLLLLLLMMVLLTFFLFPATGRTGIGILDFTFTKPASRSRRFAQPDRNLGFARPVTPLTSWMFFFTDLLVKQIMSLVLDPVS